MTASDEDLQRSRILSKSAALFATKGYESTSMNDIAQEISLSKATLYHYFRSKDSIFDEIIISTLQNLIQHMNQNLDMRLPAIRKVEKFMELHAEFFEANYHGFTAMLIGFGGMKDPGQRVLAVRLRDQYESLLRTIVKDGIANGEFRRIDAASAARAILSMLNWMARWYKPEGKVRAREFARQFADLFLNGLRVEQPCTTNSR